MKPQNENFINLKRCFDNEEQFSNGDRAAIRRVTAPETLEQETRAFYHLLSIAKIPLKELQGCQWQSWKNVVFILPWVKQAKEERTNLGAALAKADINERRLFQMVRSEIPNDLIALRRIVQHAEPTANWGKLGNILFYWNGDNKQRILRDYFVELDNQKNRKKHD